MGAGLTQEELAAAAGLSLRAVSDLERGVAASPQRGTVRSLADALRLEGPARARFESVARGRPVDSGASATRTLPRDIASFIGRQRELQLLMDAAAEASGAVGIHAIGGMAGVGKTAFAVHAAHRLAGRFPGGQVFLSLHGHTPGRRPVDSGDALASLLLTIGVPAAQVPPELEARSALWRDRLADTRLLLVLDDAASSEQVRPLLPGAGRSLVLVTSRRHLSALDDAMAISLDTLPPDEAAGMLVRLAGRPGLGQSDPGVRDLVRLCGFLPLAIGLIGRQLHHHAAWSAVGRAGALAAARDRLDLLSAENVSVAAAFDLSYANLTGGWQRLFRRLGLHPGTEFDDYAAAALDGIDLAAARRGLEALYDHYLLTEPAPGRYRMHDLIREHARALADRDDDRDRATGQLLDYYQHAAAGANALIARQDGPAPSRAVAAAVPAVPALADQGQALAWARGERANLLACLDQTVVADQHARVVALTVGLSGLLLSDGPWADAIALHGAALKAARQLGDRPGQATALNNRGTIRQRTGDHPGAARDLAEALGICRDLGDRRGQASALTILGTVWRRTGDYPAAARDLAEALGICRALGDRPGQANALVNLGAVRRLTGDYPAAIRDFAEALGIFREMGDRSSQANVLVNLGAASRMTGDFPAAVQPLQEALGIFREIGSRLGEANALYYLGVVRRLTSDYPAAARDLTAALGIFREMGDRLGQAGTLIHLGAAWRMTGDFPAAVQALQEALGIYRDIGDRGGEVEALNERGTLHRVSGELAQAQDCHRRSLELARGIEAAWDEAHALAGLGRCALAAGDAARAESLLRQALEVFQRIGAGEAVEVAAELETLAVTRDP